MKTKTRITPINITHVVFCLLQLAISSTSFAQGTAFTYQGRVTDGGNPANGFYDLRTALYATNTGGTALAGPITNASVGVSNGLFPIVLDFGSVFDGTPYWLEIAVRTNGAGAFTVLAPRQPLTPSPYAFYAEGANAAGLNGKISSAALSGTYSNAVTFNNGADIFDGTFVGQFYGPTFFGGSFSGSFFGDGGGLFDLNPAQLSGIVPDSKLPANLARTNQVWLLNGNLGTTPGVNFVGTADNQPLELHVNGQRVMRLEPTTNGAPNIIGGYSNNFVSPGLTEATIAGGGQNGFTNRITGLGYGGSIGGGNNNSVNSFNGTVSGGANNTADANASTVSGGSENFAGGDHDAIAGGQLNSTTNGYHSTVGGGLQNTNSGPLAFIGAGERNLIAPAADHATIAGGYGNFIDGSDGPVSGAIGGGNLNSIQTISAYSTIAGGIANAIQSNSFSATIGGGTNNIIQTSDTASVISGGGQNTIQLNAPYAVVAGGLQNVNGGFASSIGGGQANNTRGADGGVVGGGYGNSNGSSAATVGGGQSNAILSAADHATIAGGGGNTIVGSFALPVFGTISGGQNNSILTNTSFSTIGGGSANVIQPFAHRATIVGGSSNLVSGALGTVAGGDQNLATNNAFAAGHRAKANQSGSFVWADATEADFSSTATNQFSVRASGGVVFATGGAGITVDGQTVLAGGGATNFWLVNGNSGTSPTNGSFVGTTDNQPLELRVKGQRGLRLEPDNTGPGAPNVIGGTNVVTTGVAGAVIGGGYLNMNGGNYAFIGGGSQNQIAAIAGNAVIAGGNGNQALAGNLSTIGGGANNTNVGPFATIPGGIGNTAGPNSFAAGSGAQALNQGAFVWADASSGPIASTNNNSVTSRADGGYRLFSNSGATLGVFLAHNGVSWASISDRNAKTNFAPVDCESELDKLSRVTIERWNYKWEPEGTPSHIGPMAQDFKPAFYPGADDKSISTLEFDGVELAAIQGLNEKLKEKENKIQALEKRLEGLEKLIGEMQSEKGDSVAQMKIPDKKLRSAGD